MEKKFSPDLENKINKALSATRRFAEGTPLKVLKKAEKPPKFSIKKPFKKRIKDYLKEVNERILKAKGKILSVF